MVKPGEMERCGGSSSVVVTPGTCHGGCGGCSRVLIGASVSVPYVSLLSPPLCFLSFVSFMLLSISIAAILSYLQSTCDLRHLLVILRPWC
jgi:hypothetical protein